MASLPSNNEKQYDPLLPDLLVDCIEANACSVWDQTEGGIHTAQRRISENLPMQGLLPSSSGLTAENEATNSIHRSSQCTQALTSKCSPIKSRSKQAASNYLLKRKRKGPRSSKDREKVEGRICEKAMDKSRSLLSSCGAVIPTGITKKALQEAVGFVRGLQKAHTESLIYSNAVQPTVLLSACGGCTPSSAANQPHLVQPDEEEVAEIPTKKGVVESNRDCQSKFENSPFGMVSVKYILLSAFADLFAN